MRFFLLVFEHCFFSLEKCTFSIILFSSLLFTFFTLTHWLGWNNLYFISLEKNDLIYSLFNKHASTKYSSFAHHWRANKTEWTATPSRLYRCAAQNFKYMLWKRKAFVYILRMALFGRLRKVAQQQQWQVKEKKASERDTHTQRAATKWCAFFWHTPLMSWLWMNELQSILIKM